MTSQSCILPSTQSISPFDTCSKKIKLSKFSKVFAATVDWKDVFMFASKYAKTS
jgi:hypothetical protein